MSLIRFSVGIGIWFSAVFFENLLAKLTHFDQEPFTYSHYSMVFPLVPQPPL